ncbi:PLP-dependent aminotransferase family protein [Pseudomonas luteola]|uniref:MocR-like pyridoxine biosynthesis transcription factor PdxR n=1 Tax=Pseudomonas luteola TaxID=47886 RepID=UPI00123A5387|nr:MULTISPECIES: PLP-dependent aminotransferase family protein [Pseudomonas]MBA1246617.1 PLP-dependent aminotransferase family protein [Pseudomonas zeshuii]QEU27292.1 PLP-dependent aminotransferase family protein [Pseudomonas luteola]
MSTIRETLLLFDTPLSRAPSAASLQAQLYERLQSAILKGQLAAATRLPGSRELASALSISRNTVIAVYEQLSTEGYVHASPTGTRVARLSERPVSAVDNTPCTVGLARRIEQIGDASALAESSGALRPGIPALSYFPLSTWRRVLDQEISRAGASGLGYGDPLGEPRLRASLARYLSLSRGVNCTAEQIIITEGTQEALALSVRLLTNPGDTAWIEDPGYRGIKTAMRAGDLHIVPKRVDTEGLAVAAADWVTAPPRLIYTTPSHQYPMGSVLSVSRRLALIEQARAHGAWIIEDDYDSEFRHFGEPVKAMQGLVLNAPVVYIGSFSKTMFPALRLGFMVLPHSLMVATRASLAEMLRGGHRHEQLAMASFIEKGHFSRHLGRMRRLYRERQQILRTALQQFIPMPYELMGGNAGMHLTLRLPAHCCDQKVVEAASRYNMAPAALSRYTLSPLPEDNGLVIGYGNTATELFAPLASRLGQLLKSA